MNTKFQLETITGTGNLGGLELDEMLEKTLKLAQRIAIPVTFCSAN